MFRSVSRSLRKLFRPHAEVLDREAIEPRSTHNQLYVAENSQSPQDTKVDNWSPTMSEPPKPNIGVGDPHYTAIGEVADVWATLELHMNRTIWELANVEQFVGACITAQIVQIGGRTRALASLVALREGPPELVKKVNEFSGRAEAAARERNRIIHDPWFSNDTTKLPMQFRATADRKLEFGMHPMPLSEVHRVRDRIASLVKRFEKLNDEIFAQLPPFSRKRFERSGGIRLSPYSDQTSGQ